MPNNRQNYTFADPTVQFMAGVPKPTQVAPPVDRQVLQQSLEGVMDDMFDQIVDLADIEKQYE